MLSVMTGRLVCQPFALVHEALDFLTGDQLFTHQIPRAFDAVSPVVLAAHPELSKVSVARLDELLEPVKGDKDATWKACQSWVAEMGALLGRDSFDLTPIAKFEHKNPIAEAVEMMGGPERVAVVTLPSEGIAKP